ncbi:MAG TPA: glycerate kinase [Solirubrobacteraceae bacterium]|jgi:glycerate kinase|nr:glycerate kinase [Solirubrobacteraceae bacterium]
MPIPTTPLIVTGAFGALPAPRVAGALARGLEAGGAQRADICALPGDLDRSGPLRAALDALGLDRRIPAARAVIVGEWLLDERTLAGSAAFELATRARQSGVPCYAVTGENRLSPFDARVLDLQLILIARGARALSAAGRTLASAT